MQFSFIFIILLLCIFFENGLCQSNEGELCTIPSSNTNGTCKLLTLCPAALQSLQYQGTFPKSCGFKGNEPIVCCAIGSATDITASTFSTSKRTAVTISSTITKNGTSQVGDKSKLQCQEYEKQIYNHDMLFYDCGIMEREHILLEGPPKRKEFPHMALIGFDDEDNVTHWDCSGSLISEKFVLSAAHCSHHRHYGTPKHIFFGEFPMYPTSDDASPQTLSIRNIIRHPDYQPPSVYNDIALFELEHNVILNIYTRPACLNTNSNLTNKLAIESGWQRTSFEDDLVMTKETLNMLTNTECNNEFNNERNRLTNGIVEETQLCAGLPNGEKSSLVCQGDSGGPLQIVNQDVNCTYKIIGITTFGNSCGSSHKPRIYTRVSAYINWIEDIVWQ